MPLPNTTGALNAGVNPNDVQQKNDLSQAMNNFFRELSSKMDNTLNIRGNVQAGVFNSFGNNVITRGGTQLTDLLVDKITGLFDDEEAEVKEDPTVKALKNQFEVLTAISKTMTKTNDFLYEIDESTLGLRFDFKDLKLKLTNSGTKSASKFDSNDVKDDGIANWPALDVSEIKKDEPSQEPQNTITPKTAITKEKTINSSSLLKQQSVDDIVDTKDKKNDDEEKQASILADILDVLTHSDKKLSKLVGDKPLSTREDDLSKNRSAFKSSLSERVSNVSDAKEPAGIMGILGTVIEGLKDFGVSLLAMKAIFSKMPSTILRMLTGALGSLKTVFTGGIGGIISTLVRAIPGLLLKAIPLLMNPVTLGLLAAGGIAYGAKKLVDTIGESSITDAEGNPTKTGDALDATQKALGNDSGLKPMSSMTAVEKIEANADTGFLGLNRSKKAAHKKRYEESISQGATYTKEEAEALNKNFDITVPVTQINKVVSDVSANVVTIEQGQEDLRAKQRTASVAPTQRAPVMQSNNTTNNQTIMPTRSYPTNNEPGYRRYMDNMLARG